MNEIVAIRHSSGQFYQNMNDVSNKSLIIEYKRLTNSVLGSIIGLDKTKAGDMKDDYQGF